MSDSIAQSDSDCLINQLSVYEICMKDFEEHPIVNDDISVDMMVQGVESNDLISMPESSRESDIVLGTIIYVLFIFCYYYYYYNF